MERGINVGLFSWFRLRYKTPSSNRVSYQSAPIMNLDRDIAKNETIYAAINIRSNAIASAPITFRKNYEHVQPVEHEIAELLENPNNFQTQFDFIKLIETLRCSKGVAYVIKEYDNMMNVTSLWIMDSDYVYPVLDTDTKELWYRVSQKDGETYIHSRHIMQFTYMSNDGYTAISPLQVLKNTVDYDLEIKELSVSQIKDGLRFRLAIKIGSNLNQEKIEQYNKIISNFKKTGILYLDNGKDAQTLKTESFIDPHVFEIEGITKERIAMVYNIPLSKLSSTNADKSNDEEDLVYLKDTILPTARMYEQVLNKGLVDDYLKYKGYYIKINLNGFARANMAKRGEFYQKGIRNGWFTLNDVRELEDLPPYNDPLADVPMVSRDIIPLSEMPKLVASLSKTDIGKESEDEDNTDSEILGRQKTK